MLFVIATMQLAEPALVAGEHFEHRSLSARVQFAG
jgi:hypothetical protein